MKRIVLLIVFVIPLTAFGQKVQIEGLFNYEIGKLTTNGLSIANNEYISDIRPIFDFFYQDNTPYSEKIKYVTISNYSNFNKVCLKFYNDTLYSIIVEYPDFINAFIKKYGSGITHTKYGKVPKCKTLLTTHNLSKTYEKSIDWSNGNITAKYIKALHFHNNCEPDYYSYIEIKDTKKEKKVFSDVILNQVSMQNKKDDSLVSALDSYKRIKSTPVDSQKNRKNYHEKAKYTDEELNTMTIVRLDKPVSIKVMSTELDISINILKQWNPDYDLYMYNLYSSDYYNFRIPKNKLALFAERKQLIIKESTTEFNDIKP